jgi:aryl-alcohol dehydrogenase-like predicted oxidoreductase
MRTIRLGRTELIVTKNAFGALPIQRLSMDQAAALLKKAYDLGVRFFDTAHAYTDSEEKIGLAFENVPRQSVVLATKSGALDPAVLRKEVEMSLAHMKTDYIDILQLHNPAFVPQEDHPAYQELLKLKAEGKIRHIGLTNHQLKNAVEAVNSGLYETIQFPLSALSSPEELDLIRLAKQKDVGVICMKAMCGGLLTSAAPSMAVMDQFDHVAPIFGVQRESELMEIVALDANPPKLDEQMRAYIEKEKKTLSGEFCRGCGYCMPCPKGIEINTAARMELLLNRSPWELLVTPEQQAMMENVANCIHCGACKKRCPYGLDCPSLIAKNLDYYRRFLKEKGIVG